MQDFKSHQSCILVVGKFLGSEDSPIWDVVNEWWVRENHGLGKDLLKPRNTNYTITELRTWIRSTFGEDSCLVPVPVNDDATCPDLIRVYVSLANIWAIVSFGTARQTVTKVLEPIGPLNIPMLITVASTSNLSGDNIASDIEKRFGPHNTLRLIPDNYQQAYAIVNKIEMLQLVHHKKQNYHNSSKVVIFEDHSGGDSEPTDQYHTGDLVRCINSLNLDILSYRSMRHLKQEYDHKAWGANDYLVFIGYPKALRELTKSFRKGEIQAKSVIISDGCDNIEAHGKCYLDLAGMPAGNRRSLSE